MEFRVLGPLEVRETARRWRLGAPKSGPCWRSWLLHANEVVSSDRLIDELWGAEAPQTAAESLQVHVSQLRKVLEPERTSGEAGAPPTRSPGYVLKIDPGAARRRALQAARRERAATPSPR